MMFRPRLESLSQVLGARFPRMRLQVYEHSVGSLTSYQGFSLVLDCIFPAHVAGVGDGCSIAVSLCHLSSTPKINAGVSMELRQEDIEGGEQELEVVEELVPEDFCRGWESQNDWPMATPACLSAVDRDMARLCAAFEKCVGAAMASGPVAEGTI